MSSIVIKLNFSNDRKNSKQKGDSKIYFQDSRSRF